MFIDDLICGGDTVRRARGLIRGNQKSIVENDIVAVVLHSQWHREGATFDSLPVYGYLESEEI